MCRVWTSVSAFPGWASIFSRERIQGSQTSIMRGINHLAPNKSTYSLIPQPSMGVVLLLRVTQTHLLVHVGRCSVCKEVTLEDIALGDGNWVRDSAKPDGVSCRGLYPSAGSGGFSTRFAGENNHFKTQSLSPRVYKPKLPQVSPGRTRGFGGHLHLQPSASQRRTSKMG